MESTEKAGLNADNDRYSFACAWGDANSNGLPDLYVANDFGAVNFIATTVTERSRRSSGRGAIEDVGAGMSACWSDFDNDGHQESTSPACGRPRGKESRAQKRFHRRLPEDSCALPAPCAGQRALSKPGDGTFQNVGQQTGVAMGRWSWCPTSGTSTTMATLIFMSPTVTFPRRRSNDLASFFWRQVVAKSPEDATPSLVYEHGWNAINELIRSDNSWNGYERNVMFANNRDGTFSEVSGAVGLDFPEDSRSFALADIDHDGRLEVILKNRNAPQIRILHNAMKELGNSIAFRLRGTKSNRDADRALRLLVEAGE